MIGPVMRDPDRRQFPRIPAGRVIDLRSVPAPFADKPLAADAMNISQGGVFIETPLAIPPGALISFQIDLDSARRTMLGLVRWRRAAAPCGIGVQFVHVSPGASPLEDDVLAGLDPGPGPEPDGAKL
jgi:hypothetical protein